MILNGCSLVTPSISPNVFNSKSRFSGSYGGIPPLPSRVSNRSIRSSWKPFQGLTLQSSIGNTRLHHLAAASTPFFSGNDCSFACSTIPTVGRQKLRPFLAPPRSSIEMPWSIRYPASKGEKVKWWCRTLACLPYIISLRDTWKYWEAAYRLYPSLEQFEFLTSGFYRAFDKLPRWFVMILETAISFFPCALFLGRTVISIFGLVWSCLHVDNAGYKDMALLVRLCFFFLGEVITNDIFQLALKFKHYEPSSKYQVGTRSFVESEIERLF
ncbi:hypothetical protein C3L33_03651, partial [Rhododendron williamsianum]